MLIGLPSDDVVVAATVTMTNEDSDFPATNVQTNDPSDTAKATGVTSTFTIATSSCTPVALFIGNSNYETGTFDNNATLAAVPLTGASRTPDGKVLNKWYDLRGLSGVTATQFTVALSKSGSDPLEVGVIRLYVALQAPEVIIASAPVFGHRRPGQVENVSRGGTTFRRTAPWAPVRKLAVSTLMTEAREILQDVEAESLGRNLGVLLVPKDDDDDAWFAHCAMDDFEYTREQPDDVDELQPMRMTFQEIAMGLPPSPD